MSFIKEFQKKHNLLDDGIIGKQTLSKIKEVCKIPTDIALSHFMANCHHESNGFTKFEENLNYSAERLLVVFPKYFKTLAVAKQYHRKPQAIANIVYGGRMGNNSVGDGWKFRGRGALQTTGKNNYIALGKYLKLDLISNPDLVLQYPLESAAYFFHSNNLFKKCVDITDKTIRSIRISVNGGLNGIQEVKEKTIYYYNLLSK